MKRLLTLTAVLALAVGCESDPTAPEYDGPIIETWAGTGVNGSSPDGASLMETEFSSPMDMSFGPGDVPYIADWNNHRLLRVEDSKTYAVCGTGTLGFAPEGPALEAGLNHPTHISFGPDGQVYFAAWHNSKIMRLDDQGVIRRIAGVEPLDGTNSNRGFNGDDIPAVDAWLDLPVGTAWDSDGNLYIADQKNVRIRRVAPVNGVISDTTTPEEDRCIIETVIGDGEDRFNGDLLPPLQTSLHAPGGQAAPPTSRIEIRDDVLYFADTANNVVRRLDLKNPSAVVEIVAGGGLGLNSLTGVPNPTSAADYAGTSGDGGPATQGTLNYPTDIAFDSKGNLYIADTFNSRIRKVDPDGIITTFAGRGRNVADPNALNDGAPPTQGWLDRPYGIAVDSQDNVYIVDTYHHRIRVVRNPDTN